jgi:hypothetical protein
MECLKDHKQQKGANEGLNYGFGIAAGTRAYAMIRPKALLRDGGSERFIPVKAVATM